MRGRRGKEKEGVGKKKRPTRQDKNSRMQRKRTSPNRQDIGVLEKGERMVVTTRCSSVLSRHAGHSIYSTSLRESTRLENRQQAQSDQTQSPLRPPSHRGGHWATVERATKRRTRCSAPSATEKGGLPSDLNPPRTTTCDIPSPPLGNKKKSTLTTRFRNRKYRAGISRHLVLPPPLFYAPSVLHPGAGL